MKYDPGSPVWATDRWVLRMIKLCLAKVECSVFAGALLLSLWTGLIQTQAFVTWLTLGTGLWSSELKAKPYSPSPSWPQVLSFSDFCRLILMFFSYATMCFSHFLNVSSFGKEIKWRFLKRLSADNYSVWLIGCKCPCSFSWIFIPHHHHQSILLIFLRTNAFATLNMKLKKLFERIPRQDVLLQQFCRIKCVTHAASIIDSNKPDNFPAVWLYCILIISTVVLLPHLWFPS